VRGTFRAVRAGRFRRIERHGSGGPYEDEVGYSRVVLTEPFAFVAGCTSIVGGRVCHAGDPYEQTLAAFRIAEQALRTVGLRLADVVQTRMYVVDMGHQEAVGRAHRLLFDAVRPAATMVGVAALVDPQLLVEVEVVACRPGRLCR
jgi:enamine deaminase RidA (YjgF/YER057c/UK114 family)